MAPRPRRMIIIRSRQDFYGHQNSYSSNTCRIDAEKANLESYSRRIGRFRDEAVLLLFRPPAVLAELPTCIL